MTRNLGKRTAALLLTLCMLLLPMTALAADDQANVVFVGNVVLHNGYVTTDGSSAGPGTLSGSGASYNNGVLTLSNFEFNPNVPAKNGSMIVKPTGDLIIELVGPNTITYHSSSASTSSDTFGIWVPRDLTIRGSGTLTVKTPSGTVRGTGIYAADDMKISSYVSVTGYTRGIHSGALTINNGAEIHAYGAAGVSKGIAASGITINGVNTTVFASATGSASDSFAMGIEGGTGSVNISGTNVSVTATGGEYGIYGDTENLSFSTGARVLATGNTCALYRSYSAELLLNYPEGYQWRTVGTGNYTQSTDTPYAYDYVNPPVYFEVAPAGAVPGPSVPSVTLPVSTIESATDLNYVSRPNITAKFMPSAEFAVNTLLPQTETV